MKTDKELKQDCIDMWTKLSTDKDLYRAPWGVFEIKERCLSSKNTPICAACEYVDNILEKFKWTKYIKHPCIFCPITWNNKDKKLKCCQEGSPYNLWLDGVNLKHVDVCLASAKQVLFQVKETWKV